MAHRKKKFVLPFEPVYAAIDIGSNNVRMDLYGIDANRQLKKIDLPDKFSVPCELAKGMSQKKPVIKEKNLTKAVETLSHFYYVLTDYGIKREHTCVVMTAAIRAVRETEQGKKNIKDLSDALPGLPYTIITGEEEAILVGEAISIACSTELKKYRGKKRSIAFAAIGGGSLELGSINTKSKIKNAIALPYGIHTLEKMSKKKTTVAGKIVERGLRKHYPNHHHDILTVIGGNWRALGEAVCKRQLPATLHGKHIRKTLISAMHRPEKYYQSLGGRPAKRAEYMRLSAAILWRVAKHYQTKKIVFIETTIRDAMAAQIHARATDRLKRPASGLERLFSPSIPSLTCHA